MSYFCYILRLNNIETEGNFHKKIVVNLRLKTKCNFSSLSFTKIPATTQTNSSK